MKRVPVLPTALVALAVCAMIALGLWQLLIRLPEKEAQLALLAANPGRPAITLPDTPDDTLLFRRATGVCEAPGPIRLVGAGKQGFRAIVECTGTGDARRTFQLGTTRDAFATVRWDGGRVAGYLSHAPDARPLIAGLWDHTPKRLMLIAMPPVAGLAANTPPDISAVPNSHLAYAGQWFFFAAVATVIYTLALRRRMSSPRA